MLLLLLTLVGLLGGCSASSSAGPSHLPGSTATPSSTRGLKGTISEFPLPASDTRPEAITSGSDGALWFTAVGIRGPKGKIGRLV